MLSVQICKLTLRAYNFISVLITVDFFEHISPRLRHTLAKTHEGQVI